MKKHIAVLALTVITVSVAVLTSCASDGGSAKPVPAAPQAAAVVARDDDTVLDGLIEGCYKDLQPRLAKNLRVALLPPAAPDKSTTDYAFDELYKRFLNDDYTMPDRRDIEKAMNEIAFGMTGLVSDETAAGIGKFLGAQVIVFGEIEGKDKTMSITQRALDVQTGKILAMAIGEAAGGNAQLDKLVDLSWNALNTKLANGLRIALLPVPHGADAAAISEYITDHLTVEFINSQKYDMLERRRIEKVLTEQKFQISGLVDDKTAVEIGKLLGADAVLFGNIEGRGSNRRIVFRALEVRTGKILAMTMEQF